MSEIVDRFRRLHRDTPNRPLVHLPLAATTLTADDLHAASLEHGRALQRLGLGPDNLVILAIGNRPAAFPFWLACLSAGIAVMPVDVGATAIEIDGLARRFGATLAILPVAPQAASAECGGGAVLRRSARGANARRRAAAGALSRRRRPQADIRIDRPAESHLHHRERARRRHRADRPGHGHRARAGADWRHPVVARLRSRQRADGDAPAGHGGDPAGRVRAARAAG